MGKYKDAIVHDMTVVKGGRKCWDVADDLARAVVDNYRSVVVAHSAEMTNNYRENLSNTTLWEDRYIAKLTAWFKAFSRYAGRVSRIWREYYAPAPR